jgi:hypothetical protein
MLTEIRCKPLYSHIIPLPIQKKQHRTERKPNKKINFFITQLGVMPVGGVSKNLFDFPLVEDGAS